MVINYFVQNKLFSSFKYFTAQPESELYKTWNDLLSFVTGGECKSWDDVNEWGKTHGGSSSIIYKINYPQGRFDYYAPLDLSDFPKFNYEGKAFGDTIPSILVEIGTLLVIFLGLFWMLFKACIRYDVR